MAQLNNSNIAPRNESRDGACCSQNRSCLRHLFLTCAEVIRASLRRFQPGGPDWIVVGNPTVATHRSHLTLQHSAIGNVNPRLVTGVVNARGRSLNQEEEEEARCVKEAVGLIPAHSTCRFFLGIMRVRSSSCHGCCAFWVAGVTEIQAVHCSCVGQNKQTDSSQHVLANATNFG